MKNDDVLQEVCNCNDCRARKDAFSKQLNHPFYKAAEAFRDEIKVETLKKAAVKYNEPFNPANWTIEQLAKHAMAENYDQQNYIYGMYERLQAMEKEIQFLILEKEYWRLRAASNRGDRK